MMMSTILYNVLMAVAVAAVAFLVIRRRTAVWFVAGAMLLGLAAGLSAAVLGVGVDGSPFASARLLAHGIFIHFVAYAAICSAAWWRSARRASLLAGVCGAAVAAVGIDAFFVEPHWLEVTRHVIRSPKVTAPLRIAVLADLQTDDVGEYEREAIERLLAERPDVILLAGDYLQVEDRGAWLTQRDRLQSLLEELPLAAPGGVFAVKGNVDHAAWKEIFADTAVQAIEDTQVIDVTQPRFRVTALSVRDSFATNLQVPAAEAFHVCLGHSPNFSLGDVKADLLVAGHTHGGQVQLPLIGPLVTLSRVRRGWAAGLTEIEPGKHLLVSRGVGMERGGAPRLRFLCRPELVIVDVLPAE